MAHAMDVASKNALAGMVTITIKNSSVYNMQIDDMIREPHIIKPGKQESVVLMQKKKSFALSQFTDQETTRGIFKVIFPKKALDERNFTVAAEILLDMQPKSSISNLSENVRVVRKK